MHRAIAIGTGFSVYYDIGGSIALIDFLNAPIGARRPRPHFRAELTHAHADLTRALGADAERCARSPNAGGRSIVSEALAVEVLARTLNARDVLTEMEIVVWGGWKMVDFIARVGSTRVGVSVFRAMKHPHPDLFDQEEADRLMEKKLSGLVIARAGITKRQRHSHALLVSWIQTPEIEKMVVRAFERITADPSYDEVALFTIVAKDAPWLFYDDTRVLAPR
jgi:hypothetical protein